MMRGLTMTTMTTLLGADTCYSPAHRKKGSNPYNKKQRRPPSKKKSNEGMHKKKKKKPEEREGMPQHQQCPLDVLQRVAEIWNPKYHEEKEKDVA
jgi:hypothetical protein